MVDSFSLVFYSCLLTTLFGFTRASYLLSLSAKDLNRRGKNIFYYAAILLISVVVGFRFNVGVDWLGYVQHFNALDYNIKSMTFVSQPFEVGYYYLSVFCVKTGLGYTGLFFIIALLSWYLIFKSVDIKFLPLLIVFLFFDEQFFWSMNGVRQFTAISFFLLALREANLGSKKAAYSYIILGFLFHKSILLMIPFLFFPIHKLYNRNIFILIYLCSLFFLNNVDLFSRLDFYLSTLSGNNYALDQYSRYSTSGKFMLAEVDYGLGFYFKICLNFLLIWFSKYVIEKYSESKIYFVLFFIGAIIFNLFFGSQLIGRVNTYLVILRCFVLSFTVFYLIRDKRYKYYTYAFISLFIILFFQTIINSSNMCSPYRFTFLQ